MGFTSLLSDASHEMATAILPGFLAVLGLSPAVLGLIEGVADSTSSFVKLGSGWMSDRLGHRKPIAACGYFLTGAAQALFAIANGMPLLLAGRTLAWFGRGLRGPLRNALLANSVAPEDRGKAFGFHRAGDTIGAIIGPLLGVWLLAYLHPRMASASEPFRIIFLLTLIPGLGAAVAFVALVREKRGSRSEIEFWTTIKALTPSFRRFLLGVGIFGIGDYARTLIILAATDLLSPRYGLDHAAEIAGLLYVGHNVIYAAYSYPVGALSDRLGRRGLLSLGYAAGALGSIGFFAAFEWKQAGMIFLLALFGLSGISLATEDSLEDAITADFTSSEVRGTSFGVLGTVNGVGDLVASVVVGALWTAASPAAAFAYAAILMCVGAMVMYRVR
ncbi:MAG: MFS transporter [Acidobacteriota bacterium]|nr:MFS transporter [Acidobacteriota bacterium]